MATANTPSENASSLEVFTRHPLSPFGERVGERGGPCLSGLEDVRRRRRCAWGSGTAAAASAPPQPPIDHHPAIAGRDAAATRVEQLGDAPHRGAPGDVLLQALLGLLGDSNPLPASLLTEAGDPPRGRAFLFLRSAPEPRVGQRAHNDDLVVLDRNVYSREPAVRESSGKPTFYRTELFFIHNYNITQQVAGTH